MELGKDVTLNLQKIVVQISKGIGIQYYVRITIKFATHTHGADIVYVNNCQ